MSAFIVSKKHIDAICAAASTYPQYGLRWNNEKGLPKTLHRGDKLSPIGQMLWHENMLSVSNRYPEDEPGDMPGPIGITVDKMLSYRYQPPKHTVTPVEALKLIDAYEYQSCEHDRWDTSEAHDFCESLRRALIKALPGYDTAEWAL